VTATVTATGTVVCACVSAVHSWRSHSQDLRLLLEPEWTLGYLFRVRRQHHASLANGKWRHWRFL